MSDLRISIHGLSKRYSKHSMPESKKGPLAFSRGSAEDDTFLALDNLTLDIRRGDRIGIIGRNGAGKSTLLKILSRVSMPTAGEVRIRGRLTALLEVGTGFDKNATGRTNIYLNAGLHGLSRKEIDERFADIVAFSGIGSFLDTPVKHYSSGMYVRLAFAIAAHLDPDILLLDEVLAVGDIAFQQKCLSKIQSLTEDDHRTILFVSHSLSHVAQYCNKALWLDSGKMRFFGGVSEGIELYTEFMKPTNAANLSNHKQRKGTQLARITSVVCQNHNDPKDVLRTGSATRFIVDYEVLDPKLSEVSHFGVNIVVLNEKGIRIFGTPSEIVKFEATEVLGRRKLQCVIDDLPLKPGVYHYNVGLHINRQLVDKIEDAARFVVFDGDYYGTNELPARSFGDVCVPYSWTILQSSD